MMRVWAPVLMAAACSQDVSLGTPNPADTEIHEIPEETDVTPADPADVTRSGVMVLDRRPGHTVVADRDRGSVWVVEPEGERREVLVGAEPARLLRAGRVLWVTTRVGGEVVRLVDADEGAWEVADRASFGGEPYDLVYSASHDRLYVGLSTAHVVVALDPTTLAEVGRWALPGEPRSLAVVGAGDDERLLVAPQQGAHLWSVATKDGEVTELPLPTIRRFLNEDCGDRVLVGRVTGELVVTPGGDSVYVPMLYVNNVIPPEAPPSAVDTAADSAVDSASTDTDPTFEDCFADAEPRSGPYGGPPVGPGVPAMVNRFNPVIVELALTPEGSTRTFGVGTTLDITSPGGREIATASRGYPTAMDLDVDPSGDRSHLILSMESMSAVVVVDLHRQTLSGSETRFQLFARRGVEVAAGVNAVRVDRREYAGIFAYGWLDREVSRLSVSGVDAALSGGGPAPDASVVAAFPEADLPADVLAGRHAFYRADRGVYASTGVGVSCAACHVDGRSDGVTWVFWNDMPRQTPSLAGGPGHSLPLNWRGDVASVADKALIARRQIGARQDDETNTLERQLAAYLDTIRPVLAPREDAAQVALGEAVFHRPDVACASCHQGEVGSMAASQRVFGRALNVPSLRGLTASAPYFHDGSAGTLRAVLERARDGSMGNTASLSDAEMDALEAYLRTR